MATLSNILAWEISLTEDLAGYSLWGCKELDTTYRLNNALAGQGTKIPQTTKCSQRKREDKQCPISGFDKETDLILRPQVSGLLDSPTI